MAPPLNEQQKKEFLTDIELCGGPWSNTVASIKKEIKLRLGYDKHLYHEEPSTPDDELSLSQRLAFFLNNQKQKEPKNYAKFLKRKNVQQSRETTRKVEEQEATETTSTFVPPDDSGTGEEETTPTTPTTNNHSNEEANGDNKKDKEDSNNSNNTTTTTATEVNSNNVESLPLEPPQSFGSKKQTDEEVPSPTTPAKSAVVAKSSTFSNMSNVNDITDRFSAVSIGARTPERTSRNGGSRDTPASVQWATTTPSQFGGVTPSSFDIGTVTNPELVEIPSTSDLPFSNWQFYITRDQAGTEHGVVWRVTIQLAASPTESHSWNVVAPPSAESLENKGCTLRDHGCRSVLVKGPRMSHPMQKVLETKLAAQELSANEQRFLQRIKDEDHPHDAYYHWLIVFPAGIVFNNSTSQRNLRDAMTKVVISAANDGYPINNDVVTARYEFSIDEFQDKSASTKKKITKEKMKQMGF